MLIKENYLVKLNNKNRVQQVHLKLNKASDSLYEIYRLTSQYGGKETNQPVISVTRGKSTRTIVEQAVLVYNSHLKKYLDSGYTLYTTLTSVPFSESTEEDIKNKLGSTVTNQNGVPKPMLAKLVDQCSLSAFDSEWYVSRKLDGVRCMLYYKDGEVKSASRGGTDYDGSTVHIRTNEKVVDFFKNHPDIILDGELYKHDSDYPLQRISGLARLKEWEDACAVLEYWVYDYVSNEIFSTRWENLQDWEKLFEGTPVKILPQKKMSGWLSIKKEHDKYVQEGFEGLCMRNPDKEYGVNKRSGIYLLKMKERLDAEATIIDIKEGLRPEDMCFVLQMPNGKAFAAKPIGDAQTRLKYLQHKNDYIGKLGTYTYFSLSSDGIPTQPVFKAVRYQDDL